MTTGMDMPGYIHDHLHDYANVSSSDLEMLEWAGDHLPSCSRVLVAPGSAALFLPLYATVAIDFPMEPLQLNLSYNTVVANLTNGEYSLVTRFALLALEVTVVVVTMQNSVSYPAFQAAPLSASSDFALLYSNGDARAFGFVLGEALTGCPA